MVVIVNLRVNKSYKETKKEMAFSASPMKKKLVESERDREKKKKKNAQQAKTKMSCCVIYVCEFVCMCVCVCVCCLQIDFSSNEHCSTTLTRYFYIFGSAATGGQGGGRYCVC